MVALFVKSSVTKNITSFLSILLSTEVHCESEFTHSSHGIICKGLLYLRNSTNINYAQVIFAIFLKKIALSII